MKKATMDDFFIRTGTPYWGVRLGTQLIRPEHVSMRIVGSSGQGMNFSTKARIMRAQCVGKIESR